MATKRERLVRLMKAQEQLKKLEEQKQARLEAEIARLDRLSEEVQVAISEGQLASTVFSDLAYKHLYRIAADRKVVEEASRVVSHQARIEKRRLEKMQQHFSEFSQDEERGQAERDNLENVSKVTASKSSFRQA
jgi:hypothetical protein